LKYLAREYGVKAIRFEIIEPPAKSFFKKLFFAKFKD